MIKNQDIKKFRTTRKKFLVDMKIDYENTLENWSKYRNPIRIMINYTVVMFCRYLPPSGLKNSLYRMIGITIGRNVAIGNMVLLDPFYPELIILEDNCMLGWGMTIFTHEFLHNRVRFGSVIVGKSSLVGQFSVVRPGTTIGEKSTVAAMSYVNKDVKRNAVVGGVPIKRIR